MRKIAAVVLLAAISGCATYEQTLRSADGNEKTCAFTAHGVIGAIWAQGRQEECVAEARARGFK